MMSKQSTKFYGFGQFTIDVANRLLLRNGTPLSLQPKTFDTLLLLVEQRDLVLSKEELMRRLWPDSFVEDANLTQNIYILRKVLGQGEGGEDYIKTIPRRGYRFMARVEEVVDEAAPVEDLSYTHFNKGEVSRPDPTHQALDSLAILPLVNQSDNPQSDYLSDGITDSIISNLSQLPQLRVLARSTVFRYKDKAVDPCAAGRALGVKAVLTGRVLQFENRLIVRMELVEVKGGWQMWGAQYDREPRSILELQEEIAREISGQLQLTLSGEDKRRLSKRPTQNTEAYLLFVKGRYYLNKRLTETLKKAIEYFHRAVDVDPLFALAYAGLADSYALLSLYGAVTPQEAFPKSKAAALRALELDERLSEAQTSLGVVKLFYEWDWDGAEEAFQNSISLNPGYADAHQRFGLHLVANSRFDEAIRELRRAQELDPLSLIINTIAGYPFYYSRRYDEAIEQYLKTLEMDANFSMAHFRLGLVYAQKGMFSEALDELRMAQKLSGDRDATAAYGYVCALMGDTAEARAALAELDLRASQKEFVPSYDYVMIHAGLGETDKAVDFLEKAFDERSYWLIYLEVDPVLDSLRTHPRFAKLLKQLRPKQSHIEQVR